MKIKTSDIHVDDSWNCRGRFQLHEIKELADSIQQTGLLQPVIVVAHTGPPYRLIAGFRRYAAISLLLRWDEIDARLVEADEEQCRLINLTENLERKNLNVLQEAQAMEAAYPTHLYGCREVALRLKKFDAWVLNRRHLLKLPHDLQVKFAAGTLPISRVKSVLDSPDPYATAHALSQRTHKRRPLQNLRKRTMTDIRKMGGRLIDCGLEGFPTRLLAWVNGYITDEDIEADILKVVQEGRAW